MSFAQKLKMLRYNHGITQKELAKAIGKSARVISYYENEEYGSSVPNMEMLHALAIYFDKPISFFTDDSNLADGKQRKLLETLIDKTIDGELEWTSYESELASPDPYEDLVETFKKALEFAGLSVSEIDISTVYFLYKKATYFIFRETNSNKTQVVGGYVYYSHYHGWEGSANIINTESTQLLAEKLWNIIVGDKDIEIGDLFDQMIGDLIGTEKNPEDHSNHVSYQDEFPF